MQINCASEELKEAIRKDETCHRGKNHELGIDKDKLQFQASWASTLRSSWNNFKMWKLSRPANSSISLQCILQRDGIQLCADFQAASIAGGLIIVKEFIRPKYLTPTALHKLCWLQKVCICLKIYFFSSTGRPFFSSSLLCANASDGREKAAREWIKKQRDVF
jgi:hypothetical protein